MHHGGQNGSTRKARWHVLQRPSSALLAGLGISGPAAAETPAQFTYRVSHSAFGDIGTYTNTVEPTRDGITVQTRAHFEVKMLGVRMYREDADRTERWQGNRLVSFRGVTDKGDGPAEVKGEARGNNFVITSPQGTITAPASVHPANPWSANFLRSNTMMRPDTGKIEQVRIGAGQETTVKIDGASDPCGQIRGRRQHEIYGLDRRPWRAGHVLVDDDTGQGDVHPGQMRRAATPSFPSWTRDNRPSLFAAPPIATRGSMAVNRAPVRLTAVCVGRRSSTPAIRDRAARWLGQAGARLPTFAELADPSASREARLAALRSRRSRPARPGQSLSRALVQ